MLLEKIIAFIVKRKGKIIQIKIPKQYIKANSYIYLQGVSTEALDGKAADMY